MPRQPLKLKTEIIKAGAGAGKTTTLINTLIKCILDYQMENKTFPRVAVSTFTRKATRELKERMIVKAIELKNPDLIQYISYSLRLQISTLHGIFYRFIQMHGHKIGFSPGVTIMSQKEAHELFVSILKETVFEKKIGTVLLDHYSFEEMTDIVKQYISHIQTHPDGSPINEEDLQKILIEKKNQIQEMLKTQKSGIYKKKLLELNKEENHLKVFLLLCEELKKLSKTITSTWTQRKKELSQVTLNDLEIITMEVLKKERYNYKLEEDMMDFWFLDEYQDISPIQNDILNQMGKNSRIFIVGDPQQSIYYFRGASADVFLEKEKEVKQKSHSHIKHLKKNYRSCPELIAFFNDFFPKATFEKMEPANNNYKREKEVARFIFMEPVQTNVSKEEMEFQETKNRINDLLQKGAKPEEIAVLSRQNKPLHQLARYLKNPGERERKSNMVSALANDRDSSKTVPVSLPVHLHSSGSFKNRREIIDALFLLRFFFNPHDNENLIGLFRTPYCRIPDQTLADGLRQNANEQKKQSFWSFCIKEKTNLPVVLDLKRRLHNIQTKGITYTFQEAISDLGFIDLSYYQDPTGVREANLWKLIYCLKDYESRGGQVGLSGFTRSLDEGIQTESDHTDYSQNAVSAVESSGIQLMTIHSAKGLEFKHIILIKVCSGFRHKEGFQYFTNQRKTGKWMLSVKSKEDDKRIKSSFHKKIQEEQKEMEIQEFDRLLYVAMTRAKESLTLIGSGKSEKNSWPERFPFFLNLKSGTHQTNKYTYFVSHS